MKRVVMSTMRTVRLRNLTWRYDGNTFYASAPGLKKVDADKLSNISLEGYEAIKGADYRQKDKAVFVSTTPYINIKDTSYTTMEAFLASEGDKTITYETATPRRCLPVTYKAQQLITGQQQHFNITPTVDSQLSNLASNAIKNHVYVVIYDYLNMPQQTTPFSAFQVYDEINEIVYVYAQDSHIRGNGRWSALFTATKDSNRLLCRFRGNAGVAYDCYLERMLVDLTTLYGAGNEPSDVSTFLSQHPEYNSYVPFYDGKITQRRIIETKAKSVDLGTLTWQRQYLQSADNHYFVSQALSDVKTVLNNNTVYHAVCDKYSNTTANLVMGYSSPVVDKTFGITYNKLIVVKDNAYTDAASFKQAMQGVILTYETI